MRARRCSATAYGEENRRSDPRTSRNASSSEITCTTGVTCRNVSITDEDTAVNWSWSGDTVTRPGHSRRARVIGIAERTP